MIKFFVYDLGIALNKTKACFYLNGHHMNASVNIKVIINLVNSIKLFGNALGIAFNKTKICF